METRVPESLLLQRIEALEKDLQLYQLIEEQLEACNERLYDGARAWKNFFFKLISPVFQRHLNIKRG
jgi:hypothetical protein